MKPILRYQIFQKLPGSDLKWIETRRSLKEAKNRLKELEVLFPGIYFILDIRNAHFVFPQHSGPRNRPSKADSRKTVRIRADGAPAEPSKEYAPPTLRHIQISR